MTIYSNRRLILCTEDLYFVWNIDIISHTYVILKDDKGQIRDQRIVGLFLSGTRNTQKNVKQ